MASHILLQFFVIIALVFVASADGDGGYKLLEYDEELSAHPWQNLVQRARTPRIQRRQGLGINIPYNFGGIDKDPNYPDSNTTPTTKTMENKRKSSFEETNELDNFRKDSGVNFIYSRMPMPVILVSSYQKPKH